MKSEHLKHVAKVAFWWTQCLLKSKEPYAEKDVVLRDSWDVFHLRAKLSKNNDGSESYEIYINFEAFGLPVNCYFSLGFDDEILEYYTVRTMEHVIEDGLLRTIDDFELVITKFKSLRNHFCELKEPMNTEGLLK